MVPTDPTITGPRALATLPTIRQCFFAAARGTADLETALFRLRKQVEAQAPRGTYFCSLSSRTVVYKGSADAGPASGLLPRSGRPGISRLRSPSFTSATRPTRSPVGRWPSLSVLSPTTARSTPSAPTDAGCARRQRSLKEALQLSDRVHACSKNASATRPASTTASNCCCGAAYSPAKPACSPWCLRRGKRIRKSRPTCAASWKRKPRSRNRGTARQPWSSPTAAPSAPSSTATGCARLRYTLTSDGLLVVGSEVGIADLQRQRNRRAAAPGSRRDAVLRSGKRRVRAPSRSRPSTGIPRSASRGRVAPRRSDRKASALRHARCPASDGRPGLDRRSVQAAVSAARSRRPGSGVEHGRRRAACILCRACRVRCGTTASSASRRSRTRRSIPCAKRT